MKILFYIENLRSGGKERRLVELIKGLKKNPDIEMALVLAKGEIHYKEIFTTGIKIYYTVRKGLKKDPRLFFKFYKIAKKYKPDVIHVWGNMVAVYAIPAKVLLRVPMINNQITEVPLKIKGGLLSHQLTFKFSDCIIANSKAGLKVFNAPCNKSLCIYNGFDFNRIIHLEAKESIRKRFDIKSEFVVGMFATFSSYKDYSSYINAAINICNTNENVCFLAVGDGNCSEYKALIPQNIRNQILFLGRQNTVENIMNVCDIGVLASFTEGISNSLMELMALGKPVIASGIGGTKELIAEGENGYIIEAKKPELLTEKINFLLEHKELRKEMGKKGRRIVKHKFGIERMIDEFEKEYRSLCVA